MTPEEAREKYCPLAFPESKACRNRSCMWWTGSDCTANELVRVLRPTEINIEALEKIATERK
jgi:hypothetical protein